MIALLLVILAVAWAAFGWFFLPRVRVRIIRGQKLDLEAQLTIAREREHEYEVLYKTALLRRRG